jgi:hypothetical protein
VEIPVIHTTDACIKETSWRIGKTTRTNSETPRKGRCKGEIMIDQDELEKQLIAFSTSVQKHAMEIQDQLADLDTKIDNLETDLSEAVNRIEEVEDVTISEDEVSIRIKSCLKTFMRNALGLEASFDGK